MFLFILESIGTSELILIGLVALIFLGPRKIPDVARTFGKIMSEFRRSSNEFKETWEREVAVEINQFKEDVVPETHPKDSIKKETHENKIVAESKIALPEIKEVSSEDFNNSIPVENSPLPEKIETENTLANKQNWL